MIYNYRNIEFEIDDQVMEKYCAIHHGVPFCDKNIDVFIYNIYKVGPISTPVEFGELMKTMTPEILRAVVGNSMKREVERMW